jgi:CBS domain-containing protein
MVELREIITRDVITTESSTPVIEVAKMMSRKNISSILVVENDITRGIISERDFLHFVAEDHEPHKMTASDIMSSPVITADINTQLHQILELMWGKGVRRVPITEDGKLVGIITETNLTQALRRSKLQLEPKMEDTVVSTPPVHDLEIGKTYLFLETKPEKSMRAFEDMVKHATPGLLITRDDPLFVRKKYGLEKTPIIWLTNSSPTGEFIDPHNIVGLSLTINDYMINAEKSVVLLDGMSYLITQNQFDTILGLMQYLRDNSVKNNATLIIPLNPKTLEAKELELIKQEVDEIL